MNKKRFLALLLAAGVLLALPGCHTRSRKGSVYWLNDDPERSAAALAAADRYEREKGVTVRVVTPAREDYMDRLATQMLRRDQPTLFSLPGAEALDQWQPSCLDLRSTALAAALQPDASCLTDGESLLGLGHDKACFGLIVNRRLLTQAGHRPEEIASLEDLRRVAEDIQARSDLLGFAAFSSSGLADDSTWRFTRQLYNLPVSLEYRDRPSLAGEPIQGRYLSGYRQLLDLYLDNSRRSAASLGDLDVDDSREEFLGGKAVFYQNGSWEYEALARGGMEAEELTMLPLYIGAGDEAAQGLCTDVTGYWCVNQNAEAENLQATVDFLLWCAADEEAARALGIQEAVFPPERWDNPFLRADSAYTAAGKTAVDWNLDVLPDDRWEKEAGRALGDYVLLRDEESWESFRAVLVDGWAERAGRVRQQP